jgi:ATP-dependent Clp protease adapter protein ClpS
VGRLNIRASSIVTPEKQEELSTGSGGGRGWVVTVFDNDYNTWEEVMTILQVATGCGVEEAYMETWEIHHQGLSVVHCADKEECERVAAIIVRIGIKVTVSES